MASNRVLMKTNDGEWQLWADIVWINCLVVYFSMGVYIAHATNFTNKLFSYKNNI